MWAAYNKDRSRGGIPRSIWQKNKLR
jgi:hypothetical protein